MLKYKGFRFFRQVPGRQSDQMHTPLHTPMHTGVHRFLHTGVQGVHPATLFCSPDFLCLLQNLRFTIVLHEQGDFFHQIVRHRAMRNNGHDADHYDLVGILFTNLSGRDISSNNWFIFAAVKGNYGDKLVASLDCVVLIDVPKQIRSQRVRDRSYQKFGDRILPGGDLYDQESRWFSLTDGRPDTYVTDWLETIDCPVIRIDGTLPVEENADHLLPVLQEIR